MRRLIAPLLNERTSRVVWEEGKKLAAEMLQSLEIAAPKSAHTASTTFETSAAISGIRSIAINVLGAVGYGEDSSWQQTNSKVPAGYRLSYIESILTVCENLVPSAMLSAKFLTSPIMPVAAQKIGYALQDFPRYVQNVVKAERESTNTKVSFASTLIKASDAGNFESDGTSKIKLFLTETEITGTLFQVTVAGYDTTANTLAYALANLAIYPQWQDWITEEIDREAPPGAPRQYEKTFPKLHRVHALMVSETHCLDRTKTHIVQNEVLRIYTPVAHIMRQSRGAQQVTIGSKTYKVPPECTIYLNSGCTHVNPEIWGADALDFRPSRWLSSDGSMIRPARSTFLPFSGGPRVCPGQKMAEVEFVAVIATIFGSWRISPAVRCGETIDSARHRLKAVMLDSQPFVTLQMQRPKEFVTRWEKRSSVA